MSASAERYIPAVQVHLAQVNIGTLRAPMDDPLVADFADGLDPVYTAGEAAPGFVWRLADDSGNATSIHAFADPLRIVNLTVWESVEALRAFAFQGIHRDYLRRRGEVVRAGRVGDRAVVGARRLTADRR